MRKLIGTGKIRRKPLQNAEFLVFYRPAPLVDPSQITPTEMVDLKRVVGGELAAYNGQVSPFPPGEISAISPSVPQLSYGYRSPLKLASLLLPSPTPPATQSNELCASKYRVFWKEAYSAFPPGREPGTLPTTRVEWQ